MVKRANVVNVKNLALAGCSALALLGTIAPSDAAPVTARKSDSFVDFIGVNSHFANDSIYINKFSTLKSRLQELGVRYLRDSGDQNINDAGYQSRIAELKAAGLRFAFIADPRSATAAQVQAFVENTGAAISVEGANELDLTGNSSYGTWARDYQLQLYNAFKGDSGTASLPVLGPSFTSEYAYATATGDMSDRLDYSNLHVYWDNRHPGTYGWGSNGYGSINWQVQYKAKKHATNKPVIVTETGYSNTTIPEGISGKYLPRVLFEMFNYNGGADIKRAYIYELINGGSDASNSEHNYGLLRNDSNASPKPAFNALKNIINLLKESGANFTPGSLDYSLSGSTNDVRQTLLQKSNGEFYLCLWIEKEGMNPDSKAIITVPSQSVNINLSTPISSGTIHTLNDNGDMSSATANISNSTISLSVTDRITIVKLVKATSTGTNLVSNPGFEAEQFNTQTPSGWSEAQWNSSWTQVTADASYSEDYGGSNSGSRHGTHWKSTAYRVYTSQTKTGLANGLYTLRVRAKRGGGQIQCYLEAKDYGGSARTATLPVSNSYTLVEITGINVTNGQCTIGIWSDANANNWAYFDDFEFFKQ